MPSCVYEIWIGDYYYHGSTNNSVKRLNDHLKALKRGNHGNPKMQNAYNIKVEINKRDFGSKYEIKSYLGIPMKVMITEDMVAHKLVAMLERIGKTNRDIFDVWFFLKNNWPINEEIIQKRTGLTMRQFFKECIDQLDKMSNRGILSGIGELLDEKQKRWVKEKLRSETIFLLRLTLDSL